jgi:hypothetical protein
MGIAREFVSRFSDSDDMRHPGRWMSDARYLVGSRHGGQFRRLALEKLGKPEDAFPLH